MHPRSLLHWLEFTLLCLLFISHGLVHFIISAVLPGWPEIAGSLHDGVLFAQLTLWLLWLVFGPGRLYWRIPCGLALIGVSFVMGGGTFTAVSGNYLGALLLTYAAAVLIAAVVARWLGWRLARAGLKHSSVRQFRFGVRSLLAFWTSSMLLRPARRIGTTCTAPSASAIATPAR